MGPGLASPERLLKKIIDWVPYSPSSTDLVKLNHACLEDRGLLVCVGYEFDAIYSIGDAMEDSKVSPDSLRRVIWDNKWHRRKLIEHGVFASLGAKLGTVTDMLARSHPLTYRRKLGRTKGGVLCLVPHQTEVGDVVCQFHHSPVPFILRPLSKRQENPFEKSAWSRLLGNTLKWAGYQSDNSTAVDEEILTSLNAKKPGMGNIKIRHFNFIGECFVDGLMEEKLKYSQKETRHEVAFALH